MKPSSQQIQTIPFDIVGSATFGRYPKISLSNTFNMIISDGWLVPSPGYKFVAQLLKSGFGRGIFSSTTADKLFAVVANKIFMISIYSINPDGSVNLTFANIAEINSFYGDVFIEENDNGQIAFCDQHELYIYDYINGVFTTPTLPDGVIPGYVTYQNGRFIIPDLNTNAWYLSAVGDGNNWFSDQNGNPVQGLIQTKSDKAMAALRVAGRGNLLFVMGKNVVEFYTDVGNQLFPYQKSSSVNIDYGVLNQATLDSMDNYVMWLGINQKSDPALMYSEGGDVKQISTDGINFRLSHLKNPSASSGFFFKQDGHVLYQITFYDPKDNLTLVYDFNTQKFFTFTDEEMNHHIARRVAIFNNEYYFVSYKDGNLYRLDSELPSYDYGDAGIKEIPRVRVCSSIRKQDSSRFVCNSLTMTIEQGSDPNNVSNLNPSEIPRIDFCVSKDGGRGFGSYAPQKKMNAIGNGANRIIWWGVGAANDLIPQFRFWGFGRFMATNGQANIYQ